MSAPWEHEGVPQDPQGVLILGSTGSIGRQTIEVVQSHPELFRCVGLVAGSDDAALADQAERLGVSDTGLGSEAAERMAGETDAEIVVNAVVGSAGLRASVAALEAGKTLALANKESLVAGGELCLDAARRGGGRIVAVDSEHAALAHALEGHARDHVERIVITASGGPFRQRTDLSEVTPSEALAHPTWNMGPKISIDSATLMNKGLEVIEAHFLFGFDYGQIDVLVHAQSVVHAIVEFKDGSMIGQAGPADMRVPISQALGGPGALTPPWSRLDVAGVATLTFEPVDLARFPSLDLAYQAGKAGGTYPAALNAANEVAVAAFLDGRCRFTDIPHVVADVLDLHEPGNAGDLESVLDIDESSRRAAAKRVASVGESV